jgi:NADPH-dependent ferric siderophore reductase
MSWIMAPLERVSLMVWHSKRAIDVDFMLIHCLDTAAINLAVTYGNRCGEACGSSSMLGAAVYFPPGTYMVSSPIVQTLFIGDATSLPTIKGMANFSGIALIDTDVYIPAVLSGT